MHPYSHLTHEQLGHHLHTLRQEAALARLVRRNPSLFSRILNLFRRLRHTGKTNPAHVHSA